MATKNKNIKKNEPKKHRKRLSFSQIIFYALGIIVVLSMLATTVLTSVSY